jgi:hypothetical protein
VDEYSQVSDITVQPNPFTDKAVLIFSIPERQNIRITLTDLLGREIIISNSMMEAGKHNIFIDSEKLKLSQGMYSVRISSAKDTATIKFIKK